MANENLGLHEPVPAEQIRPIPLSWFNAFDIAPMPIIIDE
jgi:hypothetical protein